MDKKVERIIKLYSSFLEGKVVNKKEEAERFEVNQRTIQRDIDDIRMCFANDMNVDWQITYKRNKNGYVLIRDSEERLNSQEIFMLCEVFLQSKLLIKEEMFSIVDKLVQACVSREEKKKVISLLAKEKMQYEGLEQEAVSQQLIKDISDAIYTQRVVRIQYPVDTGEKPVWQIVQPMGIVFSEKHFYLTGYMHTHDAELRFGKLSSDKLPVIYRLDKVADHSVLQEHFRVPYKNQYEKADFQRLIEKEIAVSREEEKI